MAYLNHQSKSSLREYAATGVLSLAFVICLPVLGLAAFVLRGPVMLGVVGVIAAALIAGLWQVWAPGLRAWRADRRSMSK